MSVNEDTALMPSSNRWQPGAIKLPLLKEALSSVPAVQYWVAIQRLQAFRLHRQDGSIVEVEIPSSTTEHLKWIRIIA
jgi:hypothetical protein